MKPTVKCPVCGKGTYIHHKYKYSVSFKCNDKKCNHTFKQIIPAAIDDPSSEKLNGKAIFSGHRYNLNTIIIAINLYYPLNATTRAISTYLLDYMNIKVSHVTISKWIKKLTVRSITFKGSNHIVVKDFNDDISNNLIEFFNKTFKSWYKKTKGFKSYESPNSIISNFIFYYNFIKSYSSLSNLTPTQVCSVNYTQHEKVNWLVKY